MIQSISLKSLIHLKQSVNSEQGLLRCISDASVLYMKKVLELDFLVLDCAEDYFHDDQLYLKTPFKLDNYSFDLLRLDFLFRIEYKNHKC